MTWERKVLTCTIAAHRIGWLGVWDALVAAITQRPRLSVPTSYEFSVWAKVPAGATLSLDVTAPTLEEGPKP